MPPKKRVEAVEDKKEVPPATKTKKEKIKETVNHSEEVAHILEDYRQGLFELLQIIAVKFDKMTDGLAETIIRDSLNEFDDRIMERKIAKQVTESLGSTDNMRSVEEKTPKHSEPKNATQEQSSADEESPTVSPEQSVTGEKMTSPQLKEAEMEKKSEAEQSQFLKQHKELLELLGNLQRLRPEDIEQQPWILDSHALLIHDLARAYKKQEDNIDEKE